MPGRPEGNIAIITGASRGLGQYCSVQYTREGAIVVVAARTGQVQNPALPGTIHDTARMVEEAGGEVSVRTQCSIRDQVNQNTDWITLVRQPTWSLEPTIFQ